MKIIVRKSRTIKITERYSGKRVLRSHQTYSIHAQSPHFLVMCHYVLKVGQRFFTQYDILTTMTILIDSRYFSHSKFRCTSAMRGFYPDNIFYFRRVILLPVLRRRPNVETIYPDLAGEYYSIV